MLRGVFVTGTDTHVGKTVAAAALMHRFRRSGSGLESARDLGLARVLRYWKPIQTGVGQDDDTATVRRLSGCGDSDVLAEGIRLQPPLSPHLASRMSGTSIALQDLVRIVAAQPSSDRWIVEGAGGALVPINETELMVDLMAELLLPVLVVTRTTLGTINHTLLTLEALRARSLTIAGVLMIGDPNSDNREAIERFGRVAVIGELPVLKPLAPETLGHWARSELDRDGRLTEPFG